MLRFIATTCSALLASCLLLGVTGCQAAQTDVNSLMSSPGLDTPPDGQNKIWVEFQDQSAQGSAFEDTFYELIQDGVEDRGYRIVRNASDADYALWATMRSFEKIGKADALDELLETLGGIAGPMENSNMEGSGSNGTASNMGETLVGSGMGAGMKNTFTQTKYFLMLCDVQVGVRRDEADAAGGDADGSINSASSIRGQFQLAHQQRLAVSAKGSNMGLSKARQLITTRLQDAIRGQMPRYRGN